MMTEDQFREALHEIALATVSDIEGDNPDVGASYECYAFAIPEGWLGWIYMGELGDWAYVEENGKLEMAVERLRRFALSKSPYGDVPYDLERDLV